MATRGFKPETTRQNEDFARAVRIAIVKNGINRDKLLKMTGVCGASLSKRFFSEKRPPEPDKMPVTELRIYCKVLKLSDEDILKFVRG